MDLRAVQLLGLENEILLQNVTCKKNPVTSAVTKKLCRWAWCYAQASAPHGGEAWVLLQLYYKGSLLPFKQVGTSLVILMR